MNLAHPNTLFHDALRRYGTYSPRNYGEVKQGPMRLRDALSSSLNTAAVALTQKVGAYEFIKNLTDSGVDIALPAGDNPPGLGVALGGLGIRLSDLTALYVALANGGQFKSLHLSSLSIDEPTGVRLFGAEAALAVTNALVDARPPDDEVRLIALNGAPRLAYKTGTSSGRRDVWAVGYDKLHTVAVWIGRPDNASISASGRETAAPVLWSIFRSLPVPDKGVAQVTTDQKTHLSSTIPPPRLRSLNQNSAVAELQIQFPTQSGSVVREDARDGMTLRVAGGIAPYTWIVNGKFVSNSTASTLVIPVPNGPFSMTVVDAAGTTDTVKTWIED